MLRIFLDLDRLGVVEKRTANSSNGTFEIIYLPFVAGCMVCCVMFFTVNPNGLLSAASFSSGVEQTQKLHKQ